MVQVVQDAAPRTGTIHELSDPVHVVAADKTWPNKTNPEGAPISLTMVSANS